MSKIATLLILALQVMGSLSLLGKAVTGEREYKHKDSSDFYAEFIVSLLWIAWLVNIASKLQYI
jgi:hypothetical protein